MRFDPKMLFLANCCGCYGCFLDTAMGEKFFTAYLKLKHQEWNAYASHFSQWERDNTFRRVNVTEAIMPAALAFAGHNEQMAR